MHGEAPTVDLSFQLLSSEVRLQMGRVRTRKPGATRCSPSVGSLALVRAALKGFGEEKTAALDGAV